MLLCFYCEDAYMAPELMSSHQSKDQKCVQWDFLLKLEKSYMAYKLRLIEIIVWKNNSLFICALSRGCHHCMRTMHLLPHDLCEQKFEFMGLQLLQ